MLRDTAGSALAAPGVSQLLDQVNVVLPVAQTMAAQGQYYGLVPCFLLRFL